MKHLLCIISAALLATCSFGARSVPDIIPAPKSMELTKGSFKVRGAAFNCENTVDARIQNDIMAFADHLALISGKNNSFTTTVGLRANCKKDKVFIKV